MAQIYDTDEELILSNSCLCFLQDNATVLELGSASGYITRYMKEKKHCRVTCVEKIPEMAEKCKQYAEKVIVADLDADSWETEIDRQFDFIMLADVLEHLKFPEKTVAAARRFLKPTGFILTSIPNISHNAVLMSLSDGCFSYTDIGLLDDTHIHFFTRKSIFSLFEKNNLYCVAEENCEIRPCDTELKAYYFRHPLLSLSLINRADAHVYRYVEKWSMNPATSIFEAKKMSLFRRLLELCYDACCFVKRKWHMQTPRWFMRLVQQPLQEKDAERYEKYRS